MQTLTENTVFHITNGNHFILIFLEYDHHFCNCKRVQYSIKYRQIKYIFVNYEQGINK